VSAAADGFHHPATEQELVELVRTAHREGRGLRVRGSAHSVSHAIYTDPLAEVANRVNQQTPPAGENVNVILDRYRGWRVKDEARKLVEAEAGIHLGADPGDPTGTATLETSLLAQLAGEKGWTLSNTGGITRQTISGFVATGSSGGSLRHTSNANLHGFRVIDGTGEVHEVSRDDPDRSGFLAMAPSMGLLGVISTITFECVDLFAIEGQESIESVDGCAIDLIGAGDGRPTLETFLRDTDYARLEWWPQRGAERVVTWQARRIEAPPGFEPEPYERFGSSPAAAQQVIGILFTILGNLDDLAQARPKLEDAFDELRHALEVLPALRKLGAAGALLAKVIALVIEGSVDGAIMLLRPAAPLIRRELPDFFPRLLRMFVPLDDDRDGSAKGRPQRFRDWGWQGLPMDNGVSDILVPTEFTETWIPLPRTQETMALLHEYFSQPADAGEAYRRTGLYVWELYCAMPSPFWLSPAYTAGDDEWRDGAFRVDPYWFADSAGDPAETFFRRLWELLRDNAVPFRLHWGKFQPNYARGDRTWVDHFAGQYPRWDEFLALRAQRDPNNIFLTDYWRDRLGLWDEPAPAPA
jgi:D-arabinono-1,4-lactone oxidase